MPKKFTTEEFIERAKMLYGDRYDYSKVNYVNLRTPVTIICPIHGEWKSRPSNFLIGHQCIRCSAIRSASVRKDDTDSFIEKAKLVHGVDKYDYSVTKYVCSTEKVKIRCKKHGVFTQLPSAHIAGHGCHKCVIEDKRSLIAGVGIVDLYEVANEKSYTVWCHMLKRCYDERLKKRLPTYHGCTVCEEWHRYSNYKQWYDDNYVDGYDVDKDILVKGNKIYSPDTCCFVPQEINKLFLRCGGKRGLLPIGVCKNTSARSRKPYRVYLRKKKIGDYYTIEEAFTAYKRSKESHIKAVATEYYSRGEITKRVYDAMMRYQVEITD